MQGQTPATPVLPAAPADAPVQVTVTTPTTASASDVYEAMIAQRNELRSQMSRLESTRRTLSARLRSSSLTDADRSGLEQRLTSTDQQIAALDKELSAANTAVARAAAVPGAVVPPTPPVHTGIPDEAYAMGALFMLVVLLPLSIGWARRLWRKGAAVVAALPEELGIRLTRLEQATDAIAIEVERVAESQRYLTKVLAEDPSRHALGAGAAQPIAVPARDAIEAKRR